MYYYYKPQLKIKAGAATADYKSLIQRALVTPAAEQQSLFDGKQYENAVDEVSDKYVF